VFTSTNPTGGASAWAASPATPTFSSGSCPTISLCVAVAGNKVLTSTDPAANAWMQTPVRDSLASVACPSANLCVAVGSDGALEITTKPASRAWSSTTIDGARQLTSVACPSVSLCIATDSTGHVVTSADPTGGSATWIPALVDGDPCSDATPCSVEQIQTSDRTGLQTVDTSALPGQGPFLTGLALTGDVLSWNHNGTFHSITLARPTSR
jgi:hypothetical protein